MSLGLYSEMEFLDQMVILLNNFSFKNFKTCVIILYDSYYMKVTNRKLSSGDKVREVATSEWGRQRAGPEGNSLG